MSMTDLSAQPSYRATRGRVPVFRPLLNGEEFDIVVLEAVFLLGSTPTRWRPSSCTSPTLTNTDGCSTRPSASSTARPPARSCSRATSSAWTVSSAGKAALSFDLLVLGPTKMMQIGQPRYWTNKTVPSAVKDIANSNLLGITAHAHTFVWTSLAQTEESDLAMMRQLANRLGWAIFSRYGVVLCWDPLQAVHRAGELRHPDVLAGSRLRRLC